MTWAYELLDNRMNTEKTLHLGANVLIGLVFGFTLTVGFFDYLWMVVPNAAGSIQYFGSKVLEPVIMI